MGVPKYLRIQQYIRAKIDSGEWESGDLIPTEAALGAQFGCSRITVTTALRELVKDGAIYRVQGKGTYVSAQKRSADPYAGSPFAAKSTASISEMTLPGEHKCIRVEETEAPDDVAAVLGLKPGQYVICIVRVKYIDDDPAFVEKVYLSQLLYASASKGQLETKSVAMLSEMCDIVLGDSYLSAEPVICDHEISGLLGIEEGAPIMHHIVELQDIQGNPVVCEHLYSSGKQKKHLMEN